MSLELLLSQDEELPIVLENSDLMSLGIAADVTMAGHLSGEPGTIRSSHRPTYKEVMERRAFRCLSVGYSTAVIGFSLVKRLF